MRVSAKADYAVRAMVELAATDSSSERPAKGEVLADAQNIPMRFLENILGELRTNGLVQSRRGADGGYWLAKPQDAVTLAEIVRAVEGPLATVRGEAADEGEYPGAAAPLRDVWLALRVNIRRVLETVTLADVVAGSLPEPIGTLARHPEAAEERLTRFTGLQPPA
jgi:Rrf2 family protein